MTKPPDFDHMIENGLSIWYAMSDGHVARLDHSEYFNKQLHSRRDLRIMQALLRESLANIEEALANQIEEIK